jgi:D-beta-D-heptose 7-phosphate kinase / D-beta-D-heptose 1-phosphate adenosyltransferase
MEGIGREIRGRLAATGRPRVLVIGDIIADDYRWGRCNRISPEAPVPIVDVERTSFSLGGAGNVAANLAALGADVELFGALGDDEPGRRVRELVREIGAGDGLTIDRARPTTHKTRVMAGDRQLLRFDVESRAVIGAPIADRLCAGVEASLRAGCPGGLAVVLSDYGKGVVTEGLAQRVIGAARAAGAHVIGDPKGTSWTRYRGATALTPNRREAAETTGLTIDDRRSLRRALELLVQRLHLDHCVITLAEDGLALLSGGRVHHFAALAPAVRDVTGAGDTVVAALAFALACGLDFPSACRLASAAAAIAVSSVGVVAVQLEEVEALLARRPSRPAPVDTRPAPIDARPTSVPSRRNGSAEVRLVLADQVQDGVAG